MRRIGFDIDGVLADFVTPYQKLHVEVAGVDLFHPGDIADPPCWDWPKFRGYSDDITALVWERINASPYFWRELDPMLNTMLLRNHRHAVFAPNNEVYFITNRSGVRPKEQTESWLHYYLLSGASWTPTVLVVDRNCKGAVAKALRLDAYIDDNYENAVDVVEESPTTRCYLLDRRYNHHGIVNTKGFRYDCARLERSRVANIEQMLRLEGLIR